MSADTVTSQRRGRSRVRANTYDIDSPKAQGAGSLGDGTLESSQREIAALLELAEQVQKTTANAVRYSQGLITRAGLAFLRTIFDSKKGFDHYTGTNDLAASQIAESSGACERQWHRLKAGLAELGLISFVHRSVPSGLPGRPGVDAHIQISDIYWFSREELVPWLRKQFDEIVARMESKAAARAAKEQLPLKRTPLVKRTRPPRRSPSILNPVGWAIALARLAAPPPSYADEEARSLAFATQLALNAAPG
ncbi:hypothetical protein [Sphingomonas bacterium]|uniref:hypothetical protein n=1 Tax=Sphingomonas bacterium TaxID=1895847 RepID=UPI001576DC2B|nr:hypothetical protein [Sphingomonas bacterium]